MAALWQQAAPPAGFEPVVDCPLVSLPQLAGLRTEVRQALTGRPTVADPQHDHWSEQLVLVVDELASNALRHGRPPVRAVLGRRGDEWVVAVSDGSGDRPPTPAEGRDPARGGFGLYLAADLTDRHGWTSEDGVKTVWAVLRAA